MSSYLGIPMAFKSLMSKMPLMSLKWFQGVMTQLHSYRCRPSLQNLRIVKDSEHHILCFWLLLVMNQRAQVQYLMGEMGWLEMAIMNPKQEILPSLPLLFDFTP
uniref:Uncharacterized protein MANES_08G124500 n=1 Tax=Rhizophora mucronata TaxID=61149 RepID=A0A2P2IMU3_RHIMU